MIGLLVVFAVTLLVMVSLVVCLSNCLNSSVNYRYYSYHYLVLLGTDFLTTILRRSYDYGRILVQNETIL